MSVQPDQPTRFSADLLNSAAAEGARQSRSAKQQLDHWARVGRAIEMHNTAGHRRIEAAVAGLLPLSELSDEELLVANAEIDATIQERARAISFGRQLAAEGVVTVALDEQGRLVRHHPDGSAIVVTPDTL